MKKKRYLELIADLENEKLKSSLDKSYLESIESLVIGRDEPIYRLNAHFDNFDGYKLEDLKEFRKKHAKKELAKNLMRVPNPPDIILNYEERAEENHVSADWYPICPLNFNSIEDYLILLDNFSNYLDAFEFADADINFGMFFDDPDLYKEEEMFYNDIFGIKTRVEKKDFTKGDLKELSVDKEEWIIKR